MVSFLAKTRDLIIIIGIYTYFTAFVYVHFYYDAFGLSTQSLKIDYASYLVYAYDVVSAPLFVLWAGVVIVLLLAWRIGLPYLLPDRLRPSRPFLRKLARYRFAGRVLQLILLFPFLYYTSRTIARQDYLQARKNLKELRGIQFVFRNTAEGLSPFSRLDSIPLSRNELVGDMQLLKRDTNQVLRLLGETDQNYIVLNQVRYDTSGHFIPTGYIYYVNKNDVLFPRIVLRSTTIN